MKHLSFVFALILFASCQQSAPPVPADLEGFTSEQVAGSDAVRVTKKDGGDFLTEQGFLVNGAKDGTWTTYHPENKIKIITNYIDGKKNGIHMELTNRGQIELLANYTNDQYDGPYAKYKFGRPQEEMTYVNGKLDGEMKVYFNSGGKLQKLITYKNGVQDGPLKFYDEEGNVTLEYTYKNGEKVSGGIVEK